MDRTTTTLASGDLADVVKRAQRNKERVVVTSRGKKVAAIVPVEDLELIEKLEDEIDLRAARAALAQKGSIPWEKLKPVSRNKS